MADFFEEVVMATFKLNGAEIYYEDYGPKDAPAIVLSPLIFTNTSVYEPIVRMLEDHYRVIAYDHRGSGKSTRASSSSIENSAKDVAELIEKLDIGPCHFFGNCLGAFIGLNLAITRPDLLKSCILAGPNAEADDELTVKKMDAFLDYAKLQGMKESAKAFTDMWFGSTFRATQDPVQVMRREKWTRHLAKMSPEEIESARQMFHRKDVTKELSKIHCDVLVMCGDEDSPESIEACRKVAKAIPGAELRVIHHAGYALAIEQPEEVAEDIKLFVGKVERQRKQRARQPAKIGRAHV